MNFQIAGAKSPSVLTIAGDIQLFQNVTYSPILLTSNSKSTSVILPVSTSTS